MPTMTSAGFIRLPARQMSQIGIAIGLSKSGTGLGRRFLICSATRDNGSIASGILQPGNANQFRLKQADKQTAATNKTVCEGFAGRNRLRILAQRNLYGTGCMTRIIAYLSHRGDNAAATVLARKCLSM